jgi:heme A synthase
MLGLAVWAALTSAADRYTRRAAWAVLAFLGLQLVIAVSMVERGFPLWLGTAHNAGAALLLLATVTLYETLSARPAGDPRSAG